MDEIVPSIATILKSAAELQTKIVLAENQEALLELYKHIFLLYHARTKGMLTGAKMAILFYFAKHLDISVTTLAGNMEHIAELTKTKFHFYSTANAFSSGTSSVGASSGGA